MKKITLKIIFIILGALVLQLANPIFALAEPNQLTKKENERLEKIRKTEFQEYFKHLEGLDANKDKDLLEKLKRRINNQIARGNISEEDIESVLKTVKKELEKVSEEGFSVFLKRWFSLEISSRYSGFVERLIEVVNKQKTHNKQEEVQWAYIYMDIARYVLSQSHWKNNPELLGRLIEIAGEKAYIQGRGDYYRPGYQVVLENIAKYALSEAHWQNNPELVARLIETAGKQGYEYVLRNIARYVLSQPHWQNHPELLRRLIEIVTEAGAEERAKERVRKNLNIDKEDFYYGYWFRNLLKDEKQKDERVLNYIVRYALSQDQWKNHTFLKQLTQGKTPTLKRLSKAIKDGTWDKELAEYNKNKPNFGMCGSSF